MPQPREFTHLTSLGDDDPEQRARIEEQFRRMRMAGLYLERVIPIAKSCEVGLSRITLPALELYEDGSVLGYQAVTEQPFEPHRRPPGMALPSAMPVLPFDNIAVTLEDDVGTDYLCFPAHSGGSDDVWRGDIKITPRIPAEVHRLRITVKELGPNVSSEPCLFEVEL